MTTSSDGFAPKKTFSLIFNVIFEIINNCHPKSIAMISELI
jgi:hypothetical protein